MESRLLQLLLRPSLVSLSTSIFIVSIALSLENWADVASSPWLYDFFYGEYGIITSLEQSPSLLNSNWVAPMHGLVERYGYPLFILLSALGIGLFITLIVHAIRQILKLSSAKLNGSAIRTNKRPAYITARIILLALWVAYGYFFIKIIIPLCFMLSRISLDSTDFWRVLASWIGAGLLLVIALHIHVIFARLVALRPRLFGGRFDVEAALIG